MSAISQGDHLGARRVSVVIPVRNEAAKIQRCVEGILAQTIPVEEIIVLDSGSTDGTLEILRRYPKVRVLSITPESFNHGGTRNKGVRAAHGDWIVLTVGDARPADDLWIERLFDGVMDDEVAGVCGAQVVPQAPDTNPTEWFRPVSEPRIERVHFSSSGEFDRLSPSERLRVCSWDDVTALYRRDVLLRIPFPEVQYGEDALWAREALRAGHALVYNPGARVFHYHAESTDFVFRRALITMLFRHRSFGYLYGKPSVARPMLRGFRTLLRERELSWSERLSWMRHLWRNTVASRSAVRVFRAAAAAGTTGLDELEERYCASPPIPAKARS